MRFKFRFDNETLEGAQGSQDGPGGLAEIRSQAAELQRAGDQIINRALSRDSSEFIRLNQQESGQ